MRNLLTPARGVLLALLCIAPVSAANPLVGTWASTLDYSNRRAGLHILLAIGAEGHIRERVTSSLGLAYDMIGTYRMDPTGRTMRFTWFDYSPKQVCVGGNCTPLGPPERLGVTHTSRIQFQNPNFFTGTTEDGTSTKWIRTH